MGVAALALFDITLDRDGGVPVINRISHGRQLRRRGNADAIDTDPVYTYPVPMNVTLSIDDRVVAEARRIAAVRGTSLNQLVRDYLNELTRTDDAEAVIARLNALWTEEDYRSQGPWTREELHERS